MRAHHDLDLLVSYDDLAPLQDLLLDQGFSRRLIWEDENRWIEVSGVRRPTAFVEVDGRGRELDIHVVHVVPGQPPVPLCDVPWIFDGHSLNGVGTIAETPVRCVSTATQLQMHTGYELPPHHQRDVERLRALPTAAMPVVDLGNGPSHDADDALVTAIVLRADEDSCTVCLAGAESVVHYAAPFPRPRADRVLPGHLVALLAAAANPLVVWRWFDAVVLGSTAEGVQLWEPLHGIITARPRDPGLVWQPGTRAYVSAGLPGADWWLSGFALNPPERTSVDVAEVQRFYLQHDLWDELWAPGR